MLEKVLEAKAVKALSQIGIRADKFTSPGRTGVPDRICFGTNELVFFMETKQKGEKLKPRQKREKMFLESLGFKVWVIDTPEGINDMVSWYAE